MHDTELKQDNRQQKILSSSRFNPSFISVHDYNRIMSRNLEYKRTKVPC